MSELSINVPVSRVETPAPIAGVVPCHACGEPEAAPARTPHGHVTAVCARCRALLDAMMALDDLEVLTLCAARLDGQHEGAMVAIEREAERAIWTLEALVTVAGVEPGRVTGAQPIYENVTGAPYQPGDRVRVVEGVDADVPYPAELLGRVGIVQYLEYACGSGQSYPGDPMIGVRFFPDLCEEFWAEELEPLGRGAP